jgi:hypothetical protein
MDIKENIASTANTNAGKAETIVLLSHYRTIAFQGSY